MGHLDEHGTRGLYLFQPSVKETLGTHEVGLMQDQLEAKISPLGLALMLLHQAFWRGVVNLPSGYQGGGVVRQLVDPDQHAVLLSNQTFRIYSQERLVGVPTQVSFSVTNIEEHPKERVAGAFIHLQTELKTPGTSEVVAHGVMMLFLSHVVQERGRHLPWKKPKRQPFPTEGFRSVTQEVDPETCARTCDIWGDVQAMHLGNKVGKSAAELGISGQNVHGLSLMLRLLQHSGRADASKLDLACRWPVYAGAPFELRAGGENQVAIYQDLSDGREQLRPLRVDGFIR